jgi:prepilin-type N-terminal cleavage/methylation domain-containing protein
MTALSWRRGTTLVELLIVLALLGVLAGVVGLSMHRTPVLPRLSETQAAIGATRRAVIRSGHTVTQPLPDGGWVTAYPDGSVITTAPSVEPLTGVVSRDSL